VAAADARATVGRLLTLVLLEHREGQVFLTPLAEAEAAVALVGPFAPRLLAGRTPESGALAELDDPVLGRGRVWRWQGPKGAVVELRVPTGLVTATWRELLERAEANGGRPVGSEAVEGGL
jgi:hypothetical protein